MYKLYRNIDLAITLENAYKKNGKFLTQKDLSIIKKPMMLVDRKKIIWIGSESKFSKKVLNNNNIKLKSINEVDLGHAQIMPSFIECHTHSVFAGHRQNEFELRNQGVSYQQIANKGGGIKSTVKSTRKAGIDQLKLDFKKRAMRFKKQGVSTLEVKSGYGLDIKTEEKILKVIRSEKSLNIISTFLGPHACPTNFQSSEKYIDHILSKMLPYLLKEKLIDRADIFIEKGYFDKELACKYFDRLQKVGINLSCHIDQITNSKAIKKLCTYENMQSMDHLVNIDKNGIKALAKSEVTGVLLPLADLYLKMKYPPARKLLDAGARVAIATDFNPGSAPSQDLSLVGVLSRLEMQMSLAEVICAYTLNAAYALGLQDKLGSLTPGKYAHFISLDDDYDKLFYSAGYHPIKKLYFNKI